MLLISARLNMSIGSVQGNNQTHTRYWDKIWKYFEENKAGFESERTTNSFIIDDA